MTYKEILEQKIGNETTIESFLEETKVKLQITWTDGDTDKMLVGYIKNGIEVLRNDVGTSIDFDEDLEARGLLDTFVRYAWNKGEEFFIENNLERLLKLEVKYGKN